MGILLEERRKQLKSKLCKLNVLIKSVGKSFGKKEMATYSQAIKFRSDIESELSELK